MENPGGMFCGLTYGIKKLSDLHFTQLFYYCFNSVSFWSFMK